MREEIITEARSWLGTRFQYQGRVKKSLNNKGGCDCIGLIIGIAKNLNICKKATDKLDNIAYSKNIKAILVLPILQEMCTQKTLESAEIADIALFSFGGNPCHFALISDILPENNYKIIHSHLKVGQVIETIVDDYWLSKITGIYEISL